MGVGGGDHLPPMTPPGSAPVSIVAQLLYNLYTKNKYTIANIICVSVFNAAKFTINCKIASFDH